MKTIFVTSSHPLISRILASGVIDLLKKQSDLRVVLFVSRVKENYFKETFGGGNVVVEGIDTALSRRQIFFRKIALLFCSSRSQRIKWRCDVKNYWAYLFASTVVLMPGVAPIARSLLRFADYYFFPDRSLRGFFEKYQPRLVFSTDIQNEMDVVLAQEARRQGVRSLGMIRSWDNPTTKGLLRAFPDALAVNNQSLVEDVAKYNGFPKKNITVIGLPQYDFYKTAQWKSRSEFFRSFGGDPAKKLVLFAPAGDRYGDTDWQIFEMLAEAIKSGGALENIQILVRFPPVDKVTLRDFQKPPNMFFHKPGARFEGSTAKEREMVWQDVLSLGEQLYHADVLLTGPSTMIIDAAVFDTPIVFYAVDGREAGRPFCRSLRRYLEYNHLQPIINSGGAQTVLTGRAMIEAVKKYLDNPRLDAAGRKKIVDTQCWQLDGRSGERLTNLILSLAEMSSNK